ncbi:FAD dependent oxidoreductase [Macrophomina phaseolina MS6]|uniref:FAD dependent oxidoreductase n=1 Tax=Macrophomina phaseolina (strain MS6) TaxID=1126212 RepID=K2SC06_MACPH|nr:FAD dependent oxidoreductase [Macrophomina phaseolina MS6]
MLTSQNNVLTFWRDLTPLSTPLYAPTSSSPRILVVGGGVIGLVTAWALLDRGYHVTIIAKQWASYGKEQRLASQIAGALWEFPPAVCGQHTDHISLQYSKRWCMVAYHIWDALATADPTASGVRMKTADFFFPMPVEKDETQMAKMVELMASGVRGFRHDARIIEETGVDRTYGAVDAYEHLAPVIDTDTCMLYLQGLVAAKGATLITQTITGDLFDQERSLLSEHQASAIINATGLSGTELAGDETCYPIRGALIRVLNDGTRFPKLDRALTISADVAAGEIVFLVPRTDDVLLIGGLTQAHEHALDLTLDAPAVRRMRARCDAFLPGLRRAALDPDYPLAQGLRPFRGSNVRVERELRRHAAEAGGAVPSRIVHNYGHGGAGWSLCFGCAGDVLALVEETLLDLPPTAMRVEAEAPKVPELGRVASGGSIERHAKARL